MTARGWWCLFVLVLMLLVGIARDITGLIITALTLLLWFGWEWLWFGLRTRTQLNRLRVVREIGDERGSVTTLWQGRQYTVAVELHLDGPGRFPFVAAADPVPFAVQHEDGATSGDGPLQSGEPLLLGYRISCPQPGVARFEGLRVAVTDLQGFFAKVVFVRAPLELRVLPVVVARRGGGPMVKHANELIPPGIHRLKRPGTGSELLDLRDYIPGDPPRTIAWKVSARRDRLVTKEFETEVPIRCTLFLDVSSSVRVPSPRSDEEGGGSFRPLDQLVELAASVTRASANLRDLTGLCLFDENDFRAVRPERGRDHQTRLMQALAEAASLGPLAPRADPEALLPTAYALAQEVYPDLLRDEVNRVPAAVTWLVGFPRYTRHRRGKLDALHRTKRSILLWGSTLIPMGVLAVNLAVALIEGVPEWARTVLGGLLFFGVPLVAVLAWLTFLFAVLVGHNKRKSLRWRKRLAALFCARVLAGSGGDRRLADPGALAALLEDDDLFSLHLQAFLAEHQVPVAVPLYDERGHYLFALPEKVGVLAKALLQAVGRGRDNELYVLCADVLELDGRLDPLLQAVRVALSRHHQAVVVCPWPRGVPLPPEGRQPQQHTVAGLVDSLTTERLHAAFGRIRRAFARLGVQVVWAGSDEAASLIRGRIEALRAARPLAGGGLP
jgi:uncharacterized protein (DUF58 family)